MGTAAVNQCPSSLGGLIWLHRTHCSTSNMHTSFVALHEDVERLERIIVKDYKQEAKTHKEKLMQSHRVRKRIDEMQQIARKLVS